MNNRILKGILAGTLAGMMTVCCFPVIADGIDVVLNSVNIKLNGEKVASADENYTLQNGTKVPYSILYEGTTYLPVRKISEMLDVEIDWDNDTRTVLIDSSEIQAKAEIAYDSWYGAPDFGDMNGIDEMDQTATVRSTTHWYKVEDVKDEHINSYVEKLEELGYERVTEGIVKPKFKIYKKGNVEVWLDLGLYKKMVYGVTVMDTTRPICSRDYSYMGTKEDIPDFTSTFGYNARIINGSEYIIGQWDLWACLPDYFCILEEEGFKLTNVDSGYYGKICTFKKDRTSVYIKFDGYELSTVPAIVIDY